MIPESIWPGMFQAEAGSGDTARVKSTRNVSSDMAASNAIPNEHRARKKAVDNGKEPEYTGRDIVGRVLFPGLALTINSAVFVGSCTLRSGRDYRITQNCEITAIAIVVDPLT